MKSLSFLIILIILHGAVGQNGYNSTAGHVSDGVEIEIATDKNIVDKVNDDDIYYDYFGDIIEDNEEEDDDDEETTDNPTLQFNPSYGIVLVKVEAVESSDEDSEEDSDEINKELMAIFAELQSNVESKQPISAGPSVEEPREIIITNIELNVINFGSDDQNLNRDQQLPINNLFDESYNKNNNTGLLLNFNLNLSEERTFLALAVLGIIISSVCVTVFLARLQRRRLENMNAIPSPLNNDQPITKYQLMDTDAMEQGLTDFKLFGK